MTTRTRSRIEDLLPIGELQSSAATRNVAASDVSALREVASWIDTFVTQPHKDLGRAGPVCPFVQRSLERRTLWFAAERIGERSVAEVAQLLAGYRDLLLRAEPVEGDDASYKAIVIVVNDLPAGRAAEYFGNAQIQELKRPSYADHGVVIGEFYPKNAGSAIRNQNFHPFQAPVPFLLMRLAHVSDWQFFLDDDDWMGIWARRFGASAVPALAEKLRLTDWRRIER